jgi:nucleoid-associated protein YgaU
MPTPAVSRYRYCTVIQKGTELYYGLRPRYSTVPKTSDQFYDVQPGDTFASIAGALYGDPRYWWVLADFNDALDPFAALTPGDTLRAPSRQRLFLEVLG